MEYRRPSRHTNANVFLRPLYERYHQQQLVTGGETRCAVDSDIDLLSWFIYTYVFDLCIVVCCLLLQI